jgi:hypothetical protein
MTVSPIDDRTELAPRDPRSCDRHADSCAKGARRHRVVHAKQTAIVRLAVDDDLKPRKFDAQVGRPHRDQPGVARRVRVAEKPAGRRGRPSTTHTRRHGGISIVVPPGRPATVSSELSSLNQRNPDPPAKSPIRRRAIASRLRVRLRAARQVSQCRWIGDVRSATWWHHAHSTSECSNHSRDRPGWGSAIW